MKPAEHFLFSFVGTYCMTATMSATPHACPLDEMRCRGKQASWASHTYLMRRDVILDADCGCSALMHECTEDKKYTQQCPPAGGTTPHQAAALSRALCS